MVDASRQAQACEDFESLMRICKQAGTEQAKLCANLLKALLKVGNDLFIEVDDQQMIFRTLNASRSAFVTAKFAPTFFDTYEASKDMARCKVFLKPMVAVFKNTTTVQTFTIRFDTNSSFLEIDFASKDGISKRFQLVYEACDVLQAVYSKDNCGSKAVMPSAPLHECLSNFHTGVDEVTLTASQAALRIGTFVDPAVAPSAGSAALHTEMSFNAQEFDRFEIDNEGSVTFSIRELKAIASLLEVLHIPVSIHFDGPGSPIIFGAELDSGTFALDLVLSTLQDDGGVALDSASVCSNGRGVERVDSFSESRGSISGTGRGGQKDGRQRPEGNYRNGQARRKSGRELASPGSGDSIVTADTTPPSIVHNQVSRFSQASSVPATDRMDPGPGTARILRAKRGEDVDEGNGGGWWDADCSASQASLLSIPATDRRASVSPREVPPSSRCPPNNRRNKPIEPSAALNSKIDQQRSPAEPAKSGHFRPPEDLELPSAKRLRSPQSNEDQVSNIEKSSAVARETNGNAASNQAGSGTVISVGGQTNLNESAPAKADTTASDLDDEDEYVDATPSPPQT